LRLRESGIAEVFIGGSASVIVLSARLLSAINEALDKVQSSRSVKGLVVHWEKAMAGIDVREVGEALADQEHGYETVERFVDQGRAVLSRFGRMTNGSGEPISTVALIAGGACLGAGLELAMHCTFRVVEIKRDACKPVLFGVPEAALNIFMDWGGAHVMPRLIGALRSLYLMLRPLYKIDAWQALDAGLVDIVVDRRHATGVAVAESLALGKDVQPASGIHPRRPDGLGRRLERWFFDRNPIGRTILRAVCHLWILLASLFGMPVAGARTAVKLVLASFRRSDEMSIAAERAAILKLVTLAPTKRAVRNYVNHLNGRSPRRREAAEKS
jgi:enoyl-CoA hydratase/carnithine racemase